MLRRPSMCTRDPAVGPEVLAERFPVTRLVPLSRQDKEYSEAPDGEVTPGLSGRPSPGASATMAPP